MIRQLISDFLKEEDGLAAVEYAVMAAAVVAALGTAATSLFGTEGIDFAGIGASLNEAITTAME